MTSARKSATARTQAFTRKGDSVARKAKAKKGAKAEEEEEVDEEEVEKIVKQMKAAKGERLCRVPQEGRTISSRLRVGSGRNAGGQGQNVGIQEQQNSENTFSVEFASSKHSHYTNGHSDGPIYEGTHPFIESLSKVAHLRHNQY